MKRLFLLMLVLSLVNLTTAYGEVVTFDDFVLTVPPAQHYTGPGGGQYYNGSDGAGGFTSGGATFFNNFSGGFWDGWAASNTTDTTTAGFANQYSAYTGGGFNGSKNYGVGYVSLDFGGGTNNPIPISLQFPSLSNVTGAYITNTTYAYLSMRDGDGFAKKFGGASGDDPDWFKLIIKGKAQGGGYTGSVEYYLADFRFADNSQDYIIDEWTWVDLSGLGNVVGLEFSIDSSDVGDFGINTPGYFAMDDLQYEPGPVSFTGSIWLLLFGNQTDE